MKGEDILIGGDTWTIVDVAPAEPLAEMVAAILEEEGFVTMVRGASGMADVLTHLGAQTTETTLVLVPEAQAQGALDLIAETVTDYEGDDLEVLLEEMASLEGDAETADVESTDVESKDVKPPAVRVINPEEGQRES